MINEIHRKNAIERKGVFDRFTIRTKKKQKKKKYHSLGENEQASERASERLSCISSLWNRSFFLSFFLFSFFSPLSLFLPPAFKRHERPHCRGPNVNARDFLFTLSGAELVAVCTAILFTIEGTPVRGKRDVTLFQQGRYL